MPQLKRLLPVLALLAFLALPVASASASHSQEAVFQDDSQLKSDPVGTLDKLRSLGVTRVRVALTWNTIAPSPTATRAPHGFSASDPKDYGSGFGIYDQIDRDAQARGISVYFMVTGPAPRWAEGGGQPRGGPYGQWKPSAKAFGQFVKAAGARYDGSFTPAGDSSPLPKITFWSIWNEPNYGQDLSPQVIDHNHVLIGATLYRGLLDAGWSALTHTHHAPGHGNTILIGETAPRGVNSPGNWLGIKPLPFLHALYCVDSSYRPLRGSAARALGCPTTSSGTKRFRGQHPALFKASGFAAHLYALQANPGPPNVKTHLPGAHGPDPGFADLPAVGSLEATLDRLNRTYGSHTKFPIWNTEYGYRTHPPDPAEHLSQTTAAGWLNWGEYISWKNQRIASYMQYLLVDPANGDFASGLELPDGTPKATFYAYRLPLFLPVTTERKGHTLEVWGDVRPALQALAATTLLQHGQIQFQARGRGAWRTLATKSITNTRGYIDTRVKFPSSGNVRLAWTQPDGTTDYSRTVKVTVH
jgi:hypothetical protein